MDTGQALKMETEKWLLRIEREIKNTKAIDEKGREFLENIKAYIKDSGYFLGKGDLVKGFEAVVWAWSYLSISKELNLLNVTETKK